MKKVKVLFSLEPHTLLLMLETFFYLGWARLQILRPFSKVAKTLGDSMQETPNASIPNNIPELKNIANAVAIISKYTWWESKCLVRAVACMNMLKRRGIESTLYLGTAKDESGNMIAHAWLRSGPFYVTGKEGMERFTVVGKFAKRIPDERGRVQ